MSANIEKEIAERKERWVEFLKPDADPGFLFLVHYNNPSHTPPNPFNKSPEQKEERIENAWKEYERMMGEAEWIKDDKVPFLDNTTGTEIFAEALGCEVERPEDNMPFALPKIFSAAEVADIKVPELSNSSLAYLFDIADELKRRGGPNAVQKIIDIQSPMDIAALVWEKASFLMGMLDSPDAVKELSAKCAKLLVAFMDEWFSRYGTDFIAHCPSYFMRGGITLSEDEVGIVNEEMFAEFFMDELVELSKHFGGIGIHCCAASRHQWHHFKAIPGLRLINLCKPPAEEENFITDALEYFADGPVQWNWGWAPGVDPAEAPLHYPANSRVILEFGTDNKDEAILICEALNEFREGKLITKAS